MAKDKLLTLRELAAEIGRPESTVRYYRDKFLDHIPFVGTGRRRRYPRQALAVLRSIASAYASGRSRDDVRRSIASASPGPATLAVRTEKAPSSRSLEEVTNLDLLAAILDGEREQREALWQMAKEIVRLTDVLDGQDKILVEIADHAGVSMGGRTAIPAAAQAAPAFRPEPVVAPAPPAPTPAAEAAPEPPVVPAAAEPVVVSEPTPAPAPAPPPVLPEPVAEPAVRPLEAEPEPRPRPVEPAPPLPEPVLIPAAPPPIFIATPDETAAEPAPVFRPQPVPAPPAPPPAVEPERIAARLAPEPAPGPLPGEAPPIVVVPPSVAARPAGAPAEAATPIWPELPLAPTGPTPWLGGGPRAPVSPAEVERPGAAPPSGEPRDQARRAAAPAEPRALVSEMDRLRAELEAERALIERLREAKLSLEHRTAEAESALEERRVRRGSALKRFLRGESVE